MDPASRGAIVTRLRVTLAALLLICDAATAQDAERYQHSERYQYILESGANAAVCVHMQVVYNKNFRTPWKRPLLMKLVGDPEYGETSSYAFPKLPGVTHDAMAALEMSYSRLPTSAEFDAVNWREGRIKQHSGESPALVADLDIDNDGKQDVVVKSGFLRTPDPVIHGGQDYLFVFRDKTVELPTPIPGELLGALGSAGGPALITALPEVPYGLVRPFVYRGTTYLAGYRPGDGSRRSSDAIEIVKYVDGGIALGSGRRTPVQLLRVCKLRMRAVSGHK